MEPRIEILPAKKLIGKSLKMSLTKNKTFDLWKSFMPRRKEITNNITTDLISMQVYSHSFDFDPNTEFEKWATVEVSDFKNIPDGMSTFLLKGGLYAVFLHKGSSTDFSTFQYIFTTWLPNSDYHLDDRPHFEVLGEKYKNNDPDSEEEIWIPVKPMQ
ncbi:GyrI-like domain-containing protein [Fulvivirga sp. M361]|uniref:GyrI-like domain-containing protein n=1 Tax=Fulvivirga sp. M361 TaxID=2594266 RepID=UPI00117B0C4E|nr:GyrI-like domain-containing protein [Fulvivirga sp. M361]TRX51989.1 GyrI-like domain-containing protein [Fulvivirga sp. M361]